MSQITRVVNICQVPVVLTVRILEIIKVVNPYRLLSDISYSKIALKLIHPSRIK